MQIGSKLRAMLKHFGSPPEGNSPSKIPPKKIVDSEAFI
jgi:hypothetical protein